MIKNIPTGTSLAVQWLRLQKNKKINKKKKTPNYWGSISGQGT